MITMLGDFLAVQGLVSLSNAEVWGFDPRLDLRSTCIVAKRKKETIYKTEANWNKIDKDS